MEPLVDTDPERQLLAQADQAVKDTSELLKQCLATLRETETFKTMDHVPNRDEMVNLLRNMSKCQTKSELEEFFDLSPTKEVVLGNLAVLLACLDAGFFDLFSLYCFFDQGHHYLFVIALLLLVVSGVCQVVRVMDIGQEVYNLSKMLKVGFYPDVKLKPYDITNTPKSVTRVWHQFKQILQYSLHRTIQSDPDDFNELEGYDPANSEFKQDEIEDIFWIIDESIHTIPVIFYCFTPSIPLNFLVKKRTGRLASRLQNPASWINRQALLKIYCEAAFLNLVKFEAAEMTLTELGLEAIPQLFIGTIPLAHKLVWDGIWATFSTQPLYKIGLFVNSFVPVGLSMVLGTLGKLSYYFQVYDQGESFHTIRKGQPEVGVKVMNYKLVNQGISILGHILTIGPTLFILSLSCTSSLGPIPFVALVVGYGFIFYRSSPTDIPFYEAYLTWSNILSTLSISKPEMVLDKTFWTLMKKIGWFSVVVGFNAALFASEFLLSGVIDSEHLWNLFVLLGSVLLIYILGSLILFADRFCWKYLWGENFDHYVKPKLT